MDVLGSTIEEVIETVGTDLPARLGAEWLGISVWQYLLAFLLILLSLFARRLAELLLNRVLVPRLKGIGDGLIGRMIEALGKPLTAFLGLFGFYLAVQVLMWPYPADAAQGLVSFRVVTQAFEIAGAIIAIWAATRLVDVLGITFQEQAREKGLLVDVPVIPMVQRSLKIFVGVVGGLLIVQHAGYPILGLLGGLGIGGLAVALAAQDTLSNIFGSVIIFTDRPFKVGDWVVIGDVEGFVETIGFRSTRIRTWPRSLVTVPNKMIANNHITNWSAMPVRRVSFNLRVAYDATAEQMEQLVQGIYKIIEDHPGVDKGYYLVSFTELGKDGLEILVYYFSSSTVWKEHLQVRQDINLSIMRLMESLGLSVGMPGRDLYFVGQSSEPESSDALTPKS